MTEVTGSIRAGYIYSLIDYLDNYSDHREILPKETLELLHSSSLDDRLPIKYWEELLDIAIEATNDHELPLKVSAQATPKHWGIVSYIALTSKTLADAAILVKRLGHLVIDASDFDILVENEQACIRWVPRLDLENPALVLFTFVSWVTFVERYTRIKSPKVDASFSFAQGSTIETYKSIFKGDLQFSQPFTQISFPTEYLFTEVLYHEPESHTKLLTLAYSQLKLIKKQQPEIITQVISIIKQNLAKGDTSIETTARTLGISNRALQYQLKKHDYSYKKIINEIRIELAKIYLQDENLSILDIAFLLGFSEQSSFTNWFKKCFQETPLKYRRGVH